MRFWKDTSGRYLDRGSVTALLRDRKTGTLDGFTARNGRTYKGFIEVDTEERKLVVRSLGYNEGEGVSADVEYDVNTDPLGRCPFEEDCAVIESPTQFICQRQLKDEEGESDAERPKTCGFVMPRTVCKREITREEADVYLRNGKTDLLEDFTSRFDRPFSAMLTLKKTGRHGFEFPPRKPRGGKSGEAGKTSGGKRKRTTRKKKTTKKTTRKTKAVKKTTRKKGTRKKAIAKAPSKSGGTAAKRSGSSKPPKE
jgi:DNA topoisomerase-3